LLTNGAEPEAVLPCFDCIPPPALFDFAVNVNQPAPTAPLTAVSTKPHLLNQLSMKGTA
jgi:hypothetical protein